MTDGVSTFTPPDGGHTVYGVTVHEIGEDGDHIVAFGRHDKRRFLAACNHYARTIWGVENLACDRSATWEEMEAEIHHDHALLNLGDDPDFPECAWTIRWDQPEGPDTTPITMWCG